MPPAAKSKENEPIKILMPQIELSMFILHGTSPLIMHAWSEKAMKMMLDKQMGKASLKEPKDPERDFNEARYISDDGWDGIPVTAFKAALVGACRQVPGLAMTVAKRMFFVEPDGYSTKHGVGLVRILGGEPRNRQDMVRLETGVADIRFRPEYNPWTVYLKVTHNVQMISREHMSNLVFLAGASEGVGEWRPSAPKVASGSFGMWRLEI